MPPQQEPSKSPTSFFEPNYRVLIHQTTNKCDPYRPCSLCLRANVECSSSNSVNLPTGNGAPKRKRTRGPSCDDSEPSHQRPSTNSTSALFHPEEQHPIHPRDGSQAYRETDIDITTDAGSRRQSVAAGEADSAVGIAHKVNYFRSRHAFRAFHVLVALTYRFNRSFS